jgi:hypothetical protein
MQALVDIPVASANTAGQEGQVGKTIQARRLERELFFWTAREALELGMRAIRLLILMAVAAYVIESLVEGRFPGLEFAIRSL